MSELVTGMTRREFLRLVGTGSVAAAGLTIVEACSPAAPRQASAPEAETPQRGGTRTVQLTADPESLNPM